MERLCWHWKKLMSKEIYKHERPIYTPHLWQSSLSFCGCPFRGEEDREESATVSCYGQSLWQCLVHEVLFLSAKANSLWRQVGQHTYTHPHLGHRLVCPCLCLYEGWQPTHQSEGTENHYGNQHSGPGCGCSWISVETFFGIHSVPELIIEFLLLNVLPGLASELAIEK